MNEHRHLIHRLRAFGRRPVSPDVAAGHLAAMEGLARDARAGALRHRLRIVAAFAVGLVAGTSGLATAGALPHGAQEVAHRTLGAVGINVPHGDRYQGPECGGAVKNHGQYVRSQPKENRAEAARSRCGKPVQAGSGDDASPGAGPGAGCHGPPPWAGKGKPDEAARAARKQACGKGQDESDGEVTSDPTAGAERTAPGDDKATPDPAAGGERTAPLTPETTGPAASMSPTTGSADTTETTEITATTTTTAPTETTASTGGAEGITTPSIPVDPPAGD